MIYRRRALCLSSSLNVPNVNLLFGWSPNVVLDRVKLILSMLNHYK